MAEQLRAALDDAVATVAWVSEFDFPDLEFAREMLALTASDRYPIENGAIARSAGLAFGVEEFTSHVAESQVPPPPRCKRPWKAAAMSQVRWRDTH